MYSMRLYDQALSDAGGESSGISASGVDAWDSGRPGNGYFSAGASIALMILWAKAARGCSPACETE